MLNNKKLKKQIAIIKRHTINEYRETLHLFRLLKKQAKTQEDKAFIKHQSTDILKISVVLFIGALPGGTVMVAFVEMGFRKINKTILPAPFAPEIEARLLEAPKKEADQTISL